MRIFLFLLLSPLLLFSHKLYYYVEFIGAPNKELENSLYTSSSLSIEHRSSFVESLGLLQYQAEAEIPHLYKVLQSYGYYEAQIQVKVEAKMDKALVSFFITPRERYTLTSYKIILTDTSSLPPLSPSLLGLSIPQPVEATLILQAEQNLLERLGSYGFALAHIKKREMVADRKTKQLRIEMHVEPGPFSHFGPIQIQGLHKTKIKFIEKQILWKETDPYDSHKIELLQSRLMQTSLFSSVMVTNGDIQEPGAVIPLNIEIVETKSRSLNGGISYQTFFGPGATLGWENRNIAGLGQKLSLQADITKKTHSGTLTYLIPDLFVLDQDLSNQLAASYETIYTYFERSYNLTSRFEKRIDTAYRMSAGLKLERLFVRKSVQNGNFSLLEVPLYFRWSNADDLLNPLKGNTIEYRAIPSFSKQQSLQFYVAQTLCYMLYIPFKTGKNFVFAQKLLFNSIESKSLSSIPVPKRVLQGTDQEMRGYRYRTLSPLALNPQETGEAKALLPEGGRSGFFYTLETRFRISQNLGLVPFFDIGIVSTSMFPKVTKDPWYYSAGIGIRYFSFLGPLRFDSAFPLKRRANIDPRYRFLASIGQSF